MNWACALPCALDFAPIRPSTTARCTRSAHEMATFTRLKSGHWRVQVRRKQSYASETFLRREDGRRWAPATARRLALCQSPLKRRPAEPTTFRHFVDLPVTDMREVGKAPRRSQRFTLHAPNASPGNRSVTPLSCKACY